MKNKIKTPFGTIESEVSLFPLFYLITLYSAALFFPWKIWDGKSIFEIWTRWEHLSEHFQFIFYLSASFISGLNILKNRYKIFSIQNLFWFGLLIFLLITAYEEVSFLTNLGGEAYLENVDKSELIQIIRDNNTQKEINIHNIYYLENYLEELIILFNIFLGWFGWKYFNFIDAFPKKYYCLYFLICALGYSIIQLKLLISSFFLSVLPLNTETFEFLMAFGIFLHSLNSYKNYAKK